MKSDISLQVETIDWLNEGSMIPIGGEYYSFYNRKGVNAKDEKRWTFDEVCKVYKLKAFL